MKLKKTVTVVLLNEDGNILCVSRKTDHNDFGLPGGKMDPEDATELDAAIREVKEETGLDIHNLELIYANYDNDAIGYTYLANYTGEINFDEPHIVKWGMFRDLCAGSFGKWNSEVHKTLKEMKINVFY